MYNVCSKVSKKNKKIKTKQKKNVGKNSSQFPPVGDEKRFFSFFFSPLFISKDSG